MIWAFQFHFFLYTQKKNSTVDYASTLQLPWVSWTKFVCVITGTRLNSIEVSFLICYNLIRTLRMECNWCQLKIIHKHANRLNQGHLLVASWPRTTFNWFVLILCWKMFCSKTFDILAHVKISPFSRKSTCKCTMIFQSDLMIKSIEFAQYISSTSRYFVCAKINVHSTCNLLTAKRFTSLYERSLFQWLMVLPHFP